MEHTRCPFCGHDTRSTSLFCTSCGRRLAEAPSAAPPPPLQAPSVLPEPASATPPVAPVPPMPQPEARSRRPVALIAGAAAAAVVIAVLATRGGKPPAPSPTPARAAATSAPTPVAHDPGEVYRALLERPYEVAELPSGFTSAKMDTQELGSLDRKHNALGGARADVDGPDHGDVIFFTVFPTDADAKAYFEEERAPSGSDRTSTFRPAGFDVPVACDTWHHKGNATDDPERGQTFCDALVGSVVIDVVTSLTSDVQRGNNDATIALAKSAITHIRRLKGEA